MKQAALRDAKRPGHAFAPDSEQKQREAGARLKEICERKLAGLYLRLESQRGFSRLRKALLEDAALQRRVFAEPDEEALVRLLAAIAERSLVVSPDNVRTELREERRCWFERFVRRWHKSWTAGLPSDYFGKATGPWSSGAALRVCASPIRSSTSPLSVPCGIRRAYCSGSGPESKCWKNVPRRIRESRRPVSSFTPPAAARL